MGSVSPFLGSRRYRSQSTRKGGVMKVGARYLLSVGLALALAVPGAASAGKYGHGHYKHGYKHHGHGKHYGHHGGRAYRNKHITHYYKHDNSNEKLLIGLVVGGILGYAINSAQRKNTYGYPQYPPPQPTAYPMSSPQYSNNSCLQEREYQTTVIVGGKNVPAYGTACLQPDGSWRHEPAKVAAY